MEELLKEIELLKSEKAAILEAAKAAKAPKKTRVELAALALANEIFPAKPGTSYGNMTALAEKFAKLGDLPVNFGETKTAVSKTLSVFRALGILDASNVRTGNVAKVEGLAELAAENAPAKETPKVAIATAKAKA
jgi:DNA-binding transcriptional ArsR family regulator